MLNPGITIKGDEALIRSLNSLDRAVQKKIVRKALRAAAVPIKKQMRSNIRRMVGKVTGNLRKTLVTKARSGNGYAWLVVGPNYNIAPHQHLIEHGTVERFRHSKQTRNVTRWRRLVNWLTGRRRGATGRVKAVHYAALAYDAQALRAVEIGLNTIEKGIDAEVNRSAGFWT